MGQMIIPEFKIFGEFLPLKQLSGTTAGYCSGYSGRGTIIGGAMAPLAPPLSTSLKLTRKVEVRIFSLISLMKNTAKQLFSHHFGILRK